jgi:integrase
LETALPFLKVGGKMARVMAGIRKRADGSLEKRFTLNGKRYSVYGKTQKEIVSKELEIRKQVEAGCYKENKNITLDEYFEEWLNGKRSTVKGNTLKTYSCYYRKHISPHIGKRKVKQIERREVINLQRLISTNLSANTCNMVIKALTTVLNDAVRDEIILRNPAESVKTLKTINMASETYHRALTEEEQVAFMREMQGDYYYELVALLICSGMRVGEASALTWNDIDYRNNVIRINKTLTYNEQGELVVGNTPKSEAGKREIPLTESMKEILTRQRQKMQGIIPMGNSNVFQSVYGGLIHNQAINRAITNTLERLEKQGTHIEHFTAHALRDTFATRYIEQGGQPQTLKTILGHNSLAMTMDLYAHVLPTTKQKEMENLHIAL